MASQINTNSPPDLELYNIRTDAWGLLTIAAMLLILTNAIPITSSKRSSKNPAAPAVAKPQEAPYARAAIWADVFHHVVTGLGAWQHYKLPSHYNTSMGVGVWGCAGLAALGAVTAMWGMPETEGKAEKAN